MRLSYNLYSIRDDWHDLLHQLAGYPLNNILKYWEGAYKLTASVECVTHDEMQIVKRQNNHTLFAC